jgi:hypothetical protein
MYGAQLKLLPGKKIELILEPMPPSIPATATERCRHRPISPSCRSYSMRVWL